MDDIEELVLKKLKEKVETDGRVMLSATNHF